MSQPDEIGKLFVGGLSWETTQASLLAYFSRFGEVTDCVIITNPSTGKSRGFGFVTFKDPAAVEVVLAGAPHVLDGKQIDPNGCNRKKVPKGSRASLESSKRKLFVGGLPSNIDESQLKEGFSNYGKIQEVVIVYDQLKQKPRGFGFVTFESEESVEKIVKERFVLLNGKQVECKRAEARESAPSHAQGVNEQSMIMLADGSLGIIPAQGYMQQAAGPLLTPVELASAYRGAYSDIGHVMQPGGSIFGGVGGIKYITQQATAQPQYMVMGGANGGGGYLVQGAPGGGGYILQAGGGGLPSAGGMVLGQPSPYSGLMVAGPQSAGAGSYQLVAAPGGGNYLIQTPAGQAGNQGLLLQHQQAQQATQYVMHCPAGVQALLQSPLDAYNTPSHSTAAYQLSHELSGGVLGEGGGEKVVGGSPLYAQPYQVINPYASATLLNGGVTDASSDDVRAGGKQKEGATSSTTPSTTPSSSIPKLSYRILPYQSAAQLAGYSGAPHYASPLLASDQQGTIIATSPYSRLPSTTTHHKFHPYRR